MGSNEAVHIHVHPKTGHTVIVPNKKEHHHLGKKMGLKKTVSFYSLSQSRGKNKSGFSLRGFRPKGSSMNASFHGSSAHLVNAVRDAGGIVIRVVRGPEPDWFESAIAANQQVMQVVMYSIL